MEERVEDVQLEHWQKGKLSSITVIRTYSPSLGQGIELDLHFFLGDILELFVYVNNHFPA